jgi:hypothetical protein
METDSRALEKQERSAVRDYLIQVTLPIILERDGRFGIAGTGTLFKIADRRFLISAAHILDSLPPEEWAFGTTPARGVIKTFGAAEFNRSTDPKVDVCVAELKDKNAIADLEVNWRFLTLDNIWLPDLSSDAALLCGFPSAKASFEDNNLTGRMLLVRSKLLPTPPDVAESAKKGVDFFVSFENPINELTGENVSRLDIEGVSGSSLWAYRKKGWDKAAVWSPEHVLKVIGIQSAYMKNNYLRGKSWGVILSLLNELDAPIRGEARARMDEMLRLMGYELFAKT